MRKHYVLLAIVLLTFHSGRSQNSEVYAASRTVFKNHPSRMEEYSLKQGLTHVEKIFNVSIAYKDEWVEGKTATSVVSSFTTAERALTVLLENSGLSFEKAGDKFYVISQRNQKQKARSGQQGESTIVPLENISALSPLTFSNSFRSPLTRKQESVATLTGTITDESGVGFPGVNVLVKGTTEGTNTDSDGKYTLTVSDLNTTLIFSFVGYLTQEIAVGGRTVVDVVMTPDVTSLDEVVVTALGIEKSAKSLGYATSKVDAKQVTVNRTPNFMNALQGKIAGVNISSLGSGPAGTSKIRIRGQSSFGGVNSPLIVLNGVPIDNTTFGVKTRNNGSDSGVGSRGANNQSDGGDGLSSINPDDIESMTVLKGAAASALYGSRAKDGVIMINTKRRGEGKGIGVEYNTNYTMDTPLDFTDYQYEYGQGENGVRPTAANPTSGVWSFGEKFQPGMKQTLFDGVEVPYEPVRNHVKGFYRTGHTWTNTVMLSSGGEYGGFSLSIANMDNNSIMPNSDYNRKTINLGFTQTIAKKLVVSGNINYSHEKNNNPPQIAEQDLSTPTTIFSLANSMPLYLLKEKMLDASGNEFVYSRFRNRTNPYFAAYKRFDRIQRDRIFGNISARYNFTDWLYLQGRLGQDYYTRNQEYNFPTGAASLAAAPAGFVNGVYVQEERLFREINADFLAGVNRTFGDFGIDIVVGGNQMYRRTDNHSVLATDFVIRDLYTVQNGRVKDPLYEMGERKVNSLYTAAEFSYKGYLFLNATARNDWFSTLSPEERSILYPSVSGSFVFSQAFETLPGWINFGKIRAGYAEVGDDGSVGPYANNLYYAINNNLFANPSGQLQPVGIVNTLTVPNAKLRPMRVKEAEVGLEVKLLDNRLAFDVSAYSKLSNDQILGAQVSDASGYTNQLINVGESRNRGVEMLITGMPVRTTNFEWEVSFNASYNTSKVMKLGLKSGDTTITVGRGIFEGELRQVVGRSIGQLYGYGYLRDSQGRQVFDDVSGRPARTSAQIPFGTAIPQWVGGILNSFSYKGISLSFLIDFKLGSKMISATNFNAWRHGLHKETLVGREQGYVIGDGVNSDGEKNEIQTPVQTFYETVRASNLMEPVVYNAGFWKLRQVTLGYDFTKLLPENKIIKGLRVSIVSNNVLLLKKWVPNIDPEQFGFSSDNLSGLEAPGLPSTRSVGFNLNAKF